MKGKVGSECKSRVRRILETKLNGGNVIKGINTWAIPVLRYSADYLLYAIICTHERRWSRTHKRRRYCQSSHN